MSRASISRLILLAWGIAMAAHPVESVAQTVDESALKDQAEEQIRNREYRDAVATYLHAYDVSKDEKYLFNVSMLFLKTLDDPLSAWKYAVRFHEAAQTESTRAHADQLFRMVEEKLEKIRVKVVVSAEPKEAEVWLNYTSPQTRLEPGINWADPGHHKVIGRADGFQYGETPFTATLGSTAVVELSLKPDLATLEVKSNIKDTNVYVGTRMIGKAPIRKKLKPGHYGIRAEAVGYRPLENEITLVAGETRSLKAKLVPLNQPVTEATPPPEATIRDQTSSKAYRNGAYATFAIGGASLATGAVLAVLGYLDVRKAGNLDQSDYSDGYPDYKAAFDSLKGSGQTKGYAGYGVLGLGIVALGTGIALYVIADDDGETVVLPSGPGGPGITAMMRW